MTTFDPEAVLDTTGDDPSVARVTTGTIVAGTGFVVDVFGVGAASGVDALFPREPFLKVPTVPEEDPAFPPDEPPPVVSALVLDVDPDVEVEVEPDVEVEVEPVLEPELGVAPEPPRVLLPVVPPVVVPPEPELVLPEPPELEEPAEPAEPATATKVPAAPTAPPDSVPFTATT